MKDNKDTGRRLAELEEIDIEYFRALKKRRDEILAGDLPALEEILIHAAWCRDSMVTDRNHFFTSILRNLELAESEAAIIDQCIVDGSAPLLMLAREIFDQRGRYSDVARCDLYIACGDDLDAAEEAAKRLYHQRQADRFDKRFGKALRRATMEGLLKLFPLRYGSDSSDLGQVQRFGIRVLLEHGNDLDAHRQADLWLASNPEDVAAAEKGDTGLFAKLITDVGDAFGDVDEDRSEIERRDPASIVVVPELPKGTGGQKEARKAFESIAGKALPLVDRGPIDLHFRVLAARWPHAKWVIETLLKDLSTDPRVCFRPTLLVGDPGSGKSALVKAIASQLSLPFEEYSLAGMADASHMGTSAQWSTTRPSVPLQLVQRSGYANGAILWDEIEKAGTGRHNGSALDALLPLFERSQAKSVRDLALEVPVDLSWISHFATANDISEVPAPLRDRMRVIRMPDPTWEHIGTLTQTIVEDIAKERGLDPRWYPPLAPDELDVIKSEWPGGSLRKLATAVRATLDAREIIMGRA